MRWWLTGAFAAIAAVVAVVIVLVLTARSGPSFRTSAVELAAGNTFLAGERVREAGTPVEIAAVLRDAAERRQMAFYVVDGDGAVVASAPSGAAPFEEIPRREEAVASALEGRRFIRTSRDGTATLVAIPVRWREAQALLSYTLRPEIRRQIGIVRSEVLVAALWASALGIAVGFLIATLIAARLGRITRSASAIEGGDFDVPVEPQFPDEVGRLAHSIDNMRAKLRASFAAIAGERDRLDRLLARLSEGVVAVDSRGRVTFVNDCARRLLNAPGLAEGHALPEPWESPSLNAIVVALAHGEPVVQAEARPTDDTAYRITGIAGGGGIDSAILVLTDLSDRERAERAQRDFVTNASHELRTPVAAILSSVEMLQSGAKDEPEDRDEFLLHIEREARRLARLTRALLVLARAQSGTEALRPERVSVRNLLERVAGSLDPAPGVGLHVAAPPGLEARVDADVAEQAIAALALNAAKYTTEGVISLTGVRLGDGRVRVAVHDTGPGMSARVRRRVFDRFYRAEGRNADAFGLGLAIARQSVDALAGELELESAPDAGTTVTVTLPGTP